MQAVICPVCKGEGQVCMGIALGTTGYSPTLKPCHGCDGKGWVVIPEYTLTWKPRRRLQTGEPIPWSRDEEQGNMF